MKKPTCYVIVANDGTRLQPCYETEAEALAAVYEARVEAYEALQEREFRASVGKPRYTDKFENNEVEKFDAAGWHPLEVELTDTIYRTNALPQESIQLVREIVLRLRHYNTVYLVWTCFGNTRASCQGESAAEWLGKHGFATATDFRGNVEIKWKEER